MILIILSFNTPIVSVESYTPGAFKKIPAFQYSNCIGGIIVVRLNKGVEDGFNTPIVSVESSIKNIL